TLETDPAGSADQMPSLPRQKTYRETVNRAHRLQPHEWHDRRIFRSRVSASRGKSRTQQSEFARIDLMQGPGPLFRYKRRGTIWVRYRPNRGSSVLLSRASDDRWRGKESDSGNHNGGLFQRTSAGRGDYPVRNNFFPSFRIPFTTSRTISKGTSG